MEASKSCTASVAQLFRASDIFHPYPRYVRRAAPQYQMQTQITQPLPRYSLYTARLMTQSGALWPPQLKLCDLLSATTEFTNCSPPKPKVHRMWYDCFRPKPNVRRKCPFITFGAETETQAEIPSTSNRQLGLATGSTCQRKKHAPSTTSVNRLSPTISLSHSPYLPLIKRASW